MKMASLTFIGDGSTVSGMEHPLPQYWSSHKASLKIFTMDEVKRKKMRRKEKGKGGGGRIKSTPLLSNHGSATDYDNIRSYSILALVLDVD
jgi:hypothetical protein